MGGGTLLGAGIGALLGHDAEEVCNDGDARDTLWKSLKAHSEINEFLADGDKLSFGTGTLNKAQCEKVIKLYNLYVRKKDAVNACEGAKKDVAKNNRCEFTLENALGGSITKILMCEQFDEFESQYNRTGKYNFGDLTMEIGEGDFATCRQACRCMFKSLYKGDSEIYCEGSGESSDCQTPSVAGREVAKLDNIFNNVVVPDDVKSNRLKSTLVGAGIGLGTGGVATAITAFVERNNVSCRVGDGLNTVGFGKAFTIDTLKDFYVKWNLHITDTITPTAKVTSCQDWINTCGMYTSPSDCNAVEINYQKAGRNTVQHVLSACVMSGSVCIENRPVAVSYGACRADPSRVVRPVTRF